MANANVYRTKNMSNGCYKRTHIRQRNVINWNAASEEFGPGPAAKTASETIGKFLFAKPHMEQC